MVSAKLCCFDDLARRHSVPRRVPRRPPALVTQQLGSNIHCGKNHSTCTNITHKVGIAGAQCRLIAFLRKFQGLLIISRGLVCIKDLNNFINFIFLHHRGDQAFFSWVTLRTCHLEQVFPLIVLITSTGLSGLSRKKSSITLVVTGQAAMRYSSKQIYPPGTILG